MKQEKTEEWGSWDGVKDRKRMENQSKVNIKSAAKSKPHNPDLNEWDHFWLKTLNGPAQGGYREQDVLHSIPRPFPHPPHALVCEDNRASMVSLHILVFEGECKLACTVPGTRKFPYLRALTPASKNRNMHMCGLMESFFFVELWNCSSWLFSSSQSFHLSRYDDHHFKTNWLLESFVTGLWHV